MSNNRGARPEEARDAFTGGLVKAAPYQELAPLFV